MSNASNINIRCLLVIIMLCNTACMKHIAVAPGSGRIAESDFVEVTLKSGETYILKDAKAYSDYLEGKHRDKIVQIRFEQIATVEVVAIDYGKVLTYYLIGSAVTVVFALAQLVSLHRCRIRDNGHVVR